MALGKTFANHWMHHAFVIDAEGEKMSKSLGNVLNMLDLLDRYDERAYRMLLLQTHYRSPVTDQSGQPRGVAAHARRPRLVRRPVGNRSADGGPPTR